jgi:c(7)-type cytochrome triheme protein
VKKKRPLPYEYGRVVISNYSEKTGLSPVVFDHWLHRAKFTCRLCHVDIGFAMKAGATGIKASDNMSGYYCGSCHNGKKAFDGKIVFDTCSKAAEAQPRCLDTLSRKDVKAEYDFNKFTENLPGDGSEQRRLGKG